VYAFLGEGSLPGDSIFFSGTIGEEPAIDRITLGATDYVLEVKSARMAPVPDESCPVKT